MPPLRVHPENPRYFQDGAGRAVLLAGSHHWDSLVDKVVGSEPFDFEGYLDRLAGWGHNYIRLWTHEAWLHPIGPLPFPRAGPGLALDGLPKFDLDRFDPEYFGRLRLRVERAVERGFYVGVLLWNGWSIHSKGFGNPWSHHPFNRENNANGVDGDPDARGEGSDTHSLRISAVLEPQERYLRQVIETVGDLDPILWEISNESPGSSINWQRHWAAVLRRIERERGKVHPIGITACDPGGRDGMLLASPVEWIARGTTAPSARGRRPPWGRRWCSSTPTTSGGWAATRGGSGKRSSAATTRSTWMLSTPTRSARRRGSRWARFSPSPPRLEWLEPRSGEEVIGEVAGGAKVRVAAPWNRDAVLLATRPSAAR